MLPIRDVNRPLMFLRLQLSQKRVLEAGENLGLYDGLHIGATSPKFADRFVRDLGKPFILDPMSYIFTLPMRSLLDKDRKKLRPSVEDLSVRYGPIFLDIVGRRALEPSDLAEESGQMQEIVCSVLDYQKSRLMGQLNLFNPYYDKYALWIDDDIVQPIASAIAPIALMPPYFYFKTVGSPWYERSLRCAEVALELKESEESIWPVLLMASGVLVNPKDLAAIVGDYATKGFDGIFLWINAFEEERERSIEKLRGLVWLIDQMASRDTSVFKLFGGYFSALLYPLGLVGFSCGLAYGASKNAFAYGGGGGRIIRRYYVPRLHRAVSLDVAERILRMHPSLRCGCAMCVSTFGTDMEHFGMMAERGCCQAHFLNVRRRELRRIAEGGLAEAVGELEETSAEFSSSLIVNVGHLEIWHQTLLDWCRTQTEAVVAPVFSIPHSAAL